MESDVATTRKKAPEAAEPGARPARPVKRPKNLSLEADAVARGEEYSRRHGTTLSRLVGDFLRALPIGGATRELTPAVRRLRGVAVEGHTTREDHRQHLHRKYGGS